MTTRIGVQVGAVTAVRETANDAKAVAILTAVYEGLQLGPLDAPNADKLMAVTDWLVSVLQAKAFEFLLAKNLGEHRQTVEAQTRADTQF